MGREGEDLYLDLGVASWVPSRLSSFFLKWFSYVLKFISTISPISVCVSSISSPFLFSSSFNLLFLVIITVVTLTVAVQ